MSAVHDAVFALDEAIRYVAVGRGQDIELQSRSGLAAASSGESDRYEELLVNPTLVTLARQRGDIDCGGLRYLVIGYGNFHQLVVPVTGGHVSVAFELPADPIQYVDAILAAAQRHLQAPDLVP
jgi:hypothetical protein